jgi:NTP pyrophosphatase (non-canonical NTP hydrolase)
MSELQLEKATDLEQAIQLAVGVASGCWEFPEGAGQFDTAKASMVAKELYQEVLRRYSEYAPELGRSKTFREMGAEVYANCVEKGWEPDEGRTFGDEVSLLHAEVSESLEAYREIKFQKRDTYVNCAACARSGVGACDDAPHPAKPDDVASEFADILIRLLHYATVHGIDLAYEYERKMAYNRTRSYRHGGRAL